MPMLPGQELASIDFASMLGGPLIACVNAQAKAAMTTVTFVKEVGFKALPAPAPGGTPTAGVGEPVYVEFKYKKLLPTTDTVINISVKDPGSGYDPEKTKVTITPATGDSGTGAEAKATVDGGRVTAIELTKPGTGYTKVPTIAISDGASGTGATAEASLVKGGMIPTDMQLKVPILSMLPVPYLRIDDVTIDFNAKINSMEYDRSDTSLGVNASLEAKAGWGPFSAKLNVSASYKKSTQQGNSVDRTYSMAVHIHAVQEEMPAGLEKLLGILENEIRSIPAAA